MHIGHCSGICKDKQNSMGKAKSYAVRAVRNKVNDKRTNYGVLLAWGTARNIQRTEPSSFNNQTGRKGSPDIARYNFQFQQTKL